MLTKEQHLAANFLWQQERYSILQLIAGAGSGKTKTIISAIEALIKAGGSADKIALMTFSKKAAKEMHDRLSVKVNFVGTIHAFAYKQLQLRSKSKISIVNDSDDIKYGIIKRLYPNLKHLPKDVLLNDNIKEINWAIVNEEYKSYKNKRELHDFKDLILKGIEFNKSNSLGVDYLFIDEFQDISKLQLDFITSIPYKKLFVVGDDWQSIYGFQGSDVEITYNFSKDFKNVKRLLLTQNFRSQKHIVNLGNRCIKLSDQYIKKKIKPLNSYSFHTFFLKKPKCYLQIRKKNKKINFLELWQSFFLLFKKSIKRDQAFTILVRTNYIKQKLEKVIPSSWQVLTIHASKGLEFENVIIFPVADQVLPHSLGEYNEEVRVLYVAITRAQKMLNIVLSLEEGTEPDSLMKVLVKHSKLKLF